MCLFTAQVTKMMKQWDAARQCVQEMESADHKAAVKLNREISARFPGQHMLIRP